MDQPWQTILPLFYIAWMCGLMWLLWNIWRTSVKNTDMITATLIDVTRRASETAAQSAETVRRLVERLERDNERLP